MTANQHDFTQDIIRLATVDGPWPVGTMVDERLVDGVQQVFALGQAAGLERVWCYPNQVAGYAKTHITFGAHIYVTAPVDRGQLLWVPTPNLRIIVEPHWGDNAVIVYEVGCAHDEQTVRTSNCYREARCHKCGYHWAVDSSG